MEFRPDPNPFAIQFVLCRYRNLPNRVEIRFVVYIQDRRVGILDVVIVYLD